MIRQIAVLALTAAALANAQQQPPPVVSPEVSTDRKITLRIRAPQAREVSVTTNMKPGRHLLAKDEEGVWSITLGPVEPDIYSYTFSVDGVRVLDPVNPMVQTGVRSTTSLVHVAGASPAIWDEREVPHGTVHRHFYKSKAIGDTRSVSVYTPPAYDGDNKKYPVLYLLHGSGDHPGSWVEVGRANLIIDNLIADRKTVPMIVVMPFGHVTDPNDRSPNSRGQNTRKFEEDLFGDVVPLVESRYRTHKDAEHRAIAGLSMGGGQSLTVGLGHTDKFAWIGAFSSSVTVADAESRFAGLFSDPAASNKKIHLLWIAVGKDDSAVKGSQAFTRLLTEKKIEYQYQVSEGGHTWTVWRRYLAEMAPLLFRKTS